MSLGLTMPKRIVAVLIGVLVCGATAGPFVQYTLCCVYIRSQQRGQGVCV